MPKTIRFALRATEFQENLIRRAAKATYKNVTEFILTNACKAAEQALLDQKCFFLDEESFIKFQQALERPAQFKPNLAKLMKEKSPWEK
ncbi:MAG: DUF1778 domain-containing protein [Desulfobacterales bacterium]|nr:DUF1778 domain-containing protein [Desulfobacterales bacterium]